MKIKTKIFIPAVLLSIPLMAVASATGEDTPSEEFIFNAEYLEIIRDKEGYLMNQGRMLLEEERFLEAKLIAEYILLTLNKDSKEAKKLLEAATKKLEETSATAHLDVQQNF